MTFKFKANTKNIRKLALTDGPRELIEQIAERTRARAEAAASNEDEFVVNVAGKSRTRAYVTRLGSLAAEAEDSALSRSLERE